MGNTTATSSNEERFIEACKKGEMDQINRLIEQGVDVNCRDKDSQATALMWACYQGHLNVVTRLLSLKSNNDVNSSASASSSSTSTPTSPIRINIEDRDEHGYTALHWAVIHKQPEVVKLLVSQGNADVNAKNKDLETPLHKASQYGLIEIAMTLITYNALLNLKNKINKTPLDKARNADMRKLLASLGGKSGNSGSSDGQEGENNAGKEKLGEQESEELLERGVIDNEMVLKKKWKEDVRNWFKQMALSEYTEIFLQNGFDRLDVIADLTAEDLKLLDVKVGHMKVILKAITELKNNQQRKSSVSDKPNQNSLSSHPQDKNEEKAPIKGEEQPQPQQPQQPQPQPQPQQEQQLENQEPQKGEQNENENEHAEADNADSQPIENEPGQE